MAATLVAVVIFLCGVQVGRGVRSDRGDRAAADTRRFGSAAAGGGHAVAARGRGWPAGR